MLHFETIDPSTLELLKRIQSEPLFSGMNLVGGTSLAMQLGHRKSVDLDFFGKFEDEYQVITETLLDIGDVTVLKNSKNINIYLVDGVKVDFVNYRYKWLREPILTDGMRLASIEDIAAMKVNAIIGRGTKKDFIDMSVLLQYYSLSEILDFYHQKYPEASRFLAMKSLAYFADADAEEQMPYMFIDQTWEETKDIIKRSIK